MSDRLLKILVGVLAVFVLTWVVARFVADGGGEGETASLGLASSAELEIDSVVIVSADSTVRLVAGDGWTVNGHEAVAEAGESLRRGLEEARIGRLVSRNPANHDRLGVTEEKGRQVTVYSGGEARLSLIIGDQAQVLEQAYVRRPGEDRVYTLEGALVNLVNRRVDEWRERSVLAAGRDEIQRIEFSYPDESFTLVRDTSGWHLEPSGVAAEHGPVSSLLGQLAALRAIGFAAEAVVDTLSWNSPAAEVRVVGPGGVELGELVFLERDEEGVGYYVRRAGGPVVYTLSSYTGDQILKREADLITDAAP